MLIFTKNNQQAWHKKRSDLHEDFKLTVSDVCLLSEDKAICFLLATAIILKIFCVVYNLLTRSLYRLSSDIFLLLCSARLVVVVLIIFM